MLPKLNAAVGFGLSHDEVSGVVGREVATGRDRNIGRRITEGLARAIEAKYGWAV